MRCDKLAREYEAVAGGLLQDLQPALRRRLAHALKVLRAHTGTNTHVGTAGVRQARQLHAWIEPQEPAHFVIRSAMSSLQSRPTAGLEKTWLVLACAGMAANQEVPAAGATQLYPPAAPTP